MVNEANPLAESAKKINTDLSKTFLFKGCED